VKRRLPAVLATLLLLGLAPGWAAASTYTVDQTNLSFDHDLQGSYIDAQTFTDALYGPLDSVDLFLTGTPGGSVYVSVQGTTGSPAVPDGTVLTTKILSVHSPAGVWFRFDFSTNPILIPGHVYAIVFTPTNNVPVWGTKMDQYSRGRALVFSGGSWISPWNLPSPATISDFSFQTNMGLAAPTPTPTHAPTRAPTHAPTHSPAPVAIATATATTATAATATSAAATAAAATSSATATDRPVASAAASGSTAPDPGAGSAAGAGSTSGSGGSGGSMLLVFGAGVAAALLLAGGAWLLLTRRRRQAEART
jgi:hypothetical protein